MFRFALVPLAVGLLTACGGGGDIPASRPSDLATPSATGDAAEIRAALEPSCSEEELAFVMEDFAIVAETARFSELTAAERAAVEARSAALDAQKPEISAECQAGINKLV